MSAVIDTSILIEIERGNPAAIRAVQREEEVLISAISAAEFLVGAHYLGKKVPEAHEFLSRFVLVPVDKEVADLAGQMQAEHIRQGRRVDFADTIIAATAVAQNATVLVTQNTKHFSYPGLRVRSVEGRRRQGR